MIMSRAESKAKGHGRKDAYNVVYDGFVTGAGNLSAFALRNLDDFVELRVKQRGFSDWIGVAKRYGEDGGLEVCFGTGFDFTSCLLGLDGAMAANRWKADKPWSPES